MSLSSIVLARKELAMRWVSALAASLIVGAAVAMVLLAEAFATAAESATRVIQRDIGLNIVILPAQTDLDAWWIDRIPQGTMPEDWIDRLKAQDVANRLVPMLVARIQISSAEALLTGIAEERFKRDKQMRPVFGRMIEPGSIVLGALVAKSAGVEEGSKIDIKGSTFTVARVLEPTGSDEDVRAWVALEDAQRTLGLDGRLNEIRAIECHCSEGVADPFAALKTQLEPLVPGAKIVRMKALADARRSQRLLAERVLAYAVPPAIALAGVIVAILAAVNVRERRGEIGVLCAHGYSRISVAFLVLTRAVLIGLVGAILGWIVAIAVGTPIADRIMGSGPGVSLDVLFLVAVVLLTPACTALASFGPAIAAALVDPARLMRVP